MVDDGQLKYRRIVAKFGTNLLTAGTDRLDLEMMSALVGQVARLVRGGAKVVIVTSGAVSAGRHRLGRRPERKGDLAYKQVLASIGQTHLMQSYDQLFAWHDLIVGQALLTRRDLSDRLSYLNARNALQGLLDVGAVPIVNENDVVATDEIAEARIGDNDNLSAFVANLVDADLLAILTNINGLYSADPNVDATAELIPVVRDVAAVEHMAGRQISDRARGGMVTKLQAAKLATGSGIDVVIANGHERDVLPRLAGGESIGTLFPAAVDRLTGRKRWIRAGIAPRGRIDIDEGAVRALTVERRSLLPKGIVGAHGTFGAADLVEIAGPDGHRVATGVTRYGSVDLERIRGKRSDKILETLGYSFGHEVVHCDDLVLE